VLTEHLNLLDRRLAETRAARAKVATALSAATTTGQPSLTAVLDLIQEVVLMDDTVAKYFSADQLAALAERREQIGEDAIARTQAAWPQLIAKVQTALTSGLDPASAEARALGDEWTALLAAFHGGDPGLRESLFRMQAENAEAIQREHQGPSPEVLDFVRQVAQAR
jgi:hypothetical protein